MKAVLGSRLAISWAIGVPVAKVSERPGSPRRMPNSQVQELLPAAARRGASARGTPRPSPASPDRRARRAPGRRAWRAWRRTPRTVPTRPISSRRSAECDAVRTKSPLTPATELQRCRHCRTGRRNSSRAAARSRSGLGRPMLSASPAKHGITGMSSSISAIGALVDRAALGRIELHPAEGQQVVDLAARIAGEVAHALANR